MIDVMPAHNALTIYLTPELNYLIPAQVASGRAQTASEVVRAGLLLLIRTDPPPSIRKAPRPFADAHASKASHGR